MVQVPRATSVTPTAWLISAFTPLLFKRFGLTETAMPHLIPDIRFLDCSVDQLEMELITMLGIETRRGQSALTKIEQSLFSVQEHLLTNRRSKTWDAAVITAAFPNIQRKRLAAALSVKPQGASYISGLV